MIMKKGLKLAVLLFTLVCLCPVATFASPAIPTFTTTIDTNEVDVGDQVTLFVSLDNNPGISSYLLEIKYDTDLLVCEEADIKPGQVLTSGNFMMVANPNYAGTIRMVTVAAQDSKQNGALFSVTFDAVQPGTCNFELEIINLVSNMQSINADTVSSSVTICGESIPAVDTPLPPPSGGIPFEIQFVDVPETHWAHTYIQEAVKAKLFSGIGNGMFGPAMNVTRGMFVTTLYSSAGSPDVELSNFTDVPADAWYAKAVAWASQQGIVSGIGDNKFGPDLPITREQIALILFNYADGVSPGTEMFVRLAYPDAKDIHDWAMTAFTWAMNKELISGKSGNILDPLATATRAEVAVIMQNFVNLSK